MAHVSLKNVGKIYPGDVVAVEDVNLDIDQGEFIVLVGPSGCGKSTTLRMVAGLEEISLGTIEIAGRIVNDLPPKTRDIAMVFQNYALYPHMTVFDNMAFALRLKGASKSDIERRVHRTAEVLGISKLLGRKPGQLSGGQRQRVAVGRAMVREPAVYLFDEPLSNLDARLRVEMRAELKRLHASLRTTTIYVTHDQEEAMTLGDRVVVMSEGRVQQCAPPLEIYHRPANRFVAGFLGTPPMNFVEGRLNQRSFRGEDITVDLSARWNDSLEAHAGQSVTLGIRPDDIELSLASEQSNGPRCTIDLVEPLGGTMDVYLSSAAGVRLVARVKATEQLRPGVQVTALIPSDRAHVFGAGAHGPNLTLQAAERVAA